MPTAFLAKEAIFWKSRKKTLAQQGLDRLIGGGHKILWAFLRNKPRALLAAHLARKGPCLAGQGARKVEALAVFGHVSALFLVVPRQTGEIGMVAT